MSALVLPGKIDALLRRCSPGVYETVDAASDVGAMVSQRCVVGLIQSGGLGGCASVSFEQEGVPLQEDEVLLSDIALDLTYATGRVHAAWWLADALPDEAHAGVHAAMELWLRRNCTEAERLQMWEELGEWSGEYGSGILDYLDPSDPTPLPDGSRWVDAEALRRVVLHVWESTTGRPA